VIETAEMAFYRGVARMTRDFLTSEAEDIERRLERAGGEPETE
jgi:TorA maturation chaperone TorD